MIRLAITSAFAAFLASCEHCAECPQIPLQSGSYQTVVGGPGSGTPAGTFPWGSENKTIDVDLAQHVVRLRYVRDGHQIEETWRIASLTECPAP